MKIVSNTGPLILIALAKIDRLFILKDIASEVLIPPAVHRELLGKVGIESERIDNALNNFIRVTDLKLLNSAIKEALIDLDEGERQLGGLQRKISKRRFSMMGKKRFVEKNSMLVKEFDKYILEHPKFADKIPNNALIVMQVEDDE